MSEIMKKFDKFSLKFPVQKHSDKQIAEDAAKKAGLSQNDFMIARIKNESRKLPINNPHIEQELIDSIDKPILELDSAVSDFDASLYQLQKLSAELDLNDIHSERQKLREQLYVVSKRV